MTTLDSYSDLLGLEQPVVSTRDAAARWQKTQQVAGQRLRKMEESGLVRRLRRGLWVLASKAEPVVIAPYLTSPYPAYVSFWSALAEHGMFEQIPRVISVASTARSQRISTEVGEFQVHHLAPELFGGFEGSADRGYMATAEKALFDTVYVRTAAGSRPSFPELTLPRRFVKNRLREWTDRIESKRLRTLVARHLRATLREADRE